jgi:antitoxin VapB
MELDCWMPKVYTWKVDTFGGGHDQQDSQAVRLPAEFRFDPSDEVYIRRDQVTGDVVLSVKPASSSWGDFFVLRDVAGVPDEGYMSERPLNETLQPRKSLGSP